MLKMKKLNEKAENSKEVIYDNLYILNETPIEDTEYIELIIKTIQRLPIRIRKRVLNNVRFILINATTYGACRGLNFNEVVTDVKKIGKGYLVRKRIHLILLNFYAMEQNKKSKKYMMKVIAHEIAHYILGHSHMSKRGRPNNERDADDLIEKWGFKRFYKTYKQSLRKNEPI